MKIKRVSFIVGCADDETPDFLSSAISAAWESLDSRGVFIENWESIECTDPLVIQQFEEEYGDVET